MAYTKLVKPCQQEGLCSYWADCPFSHDISACMKALSLEDDLIDEIE